MNRYAYKPWKFYALALAISWAAWFLAAYFSYQTGKEPFMLLSMIAGSNVPFVVGLFMIYGSGSAALKQDYVSRLLRVNRDSLRYLPIILLLLPVSLLVAVAISVLFGRSPAQFTLAGELSLLIPILAPTFEELGWRGYGLDSLRSRYNLLTTSLLFALLWGLWHVPMFLVNTTYQHELWQMGIPYALNFFVSLVPFTIIVNWLYYKTNRSILSAILFHVIAVIAPEAFNVEESTKFIQTGILVVVAVGIMAKDRAFFSAHSAAEHSQAVSAT